MDKYSRHSWMNAETYNNLISAFGKNFDLFTPRELALFCTGLS